MKYHQPLDDLLGQRSKVSILRHLCRTRAELSGRQLAVDLNLSPWACHLALQELVDQGVLAMRAVGHAHLFRLNEGNYVVEQLLQPLFEREANLLEDAVRHIVADLPDSVVSVILYGSVARREERPYSDIDLLVLVAATREHEPVQDLFDRKNESHVGRFGSVLAPLILPVAEFRRRFRQGDALLREIARTGRPIFGASIAEVISRVPEKARHANHRAQ